GRAERRDQGALRAAVARALRERETLGRRHHRSGRHARRARGIARGRGERTAPARAAARHPEDVTMALPVDAPTIPPPRSMLFVPADSEKKLAHARTTSADALILALGDSVDAARKDRARALAAEFVRDEHARPIFVRINALDAPEARADLDAILPARPDGLVVPKVRAADDVARLSVLLDALEPRAGVPPGATAIMPIATETPAGVFALGRYAGASPRLAYLTWGAEDLSAALGAETAVDADGEWLPPYQLVRALCLLAAADAGVPAIDTVHTDLVDETRLMRQALAAKRDGFVGKL